METATRSLVKTIIYRVFITVVTAIVFTMLGRDMNQAITESIGINFFYAICYFINERVWNRIQWGRI